MQDDAKSVIIPAKLRKKGWYVEVPTTGVSSIILKGSTLRGYALSVPNHLRTGSYWTHVYNLTRLDLEAISKAIAAVLEGEDGDA